MGSAGGGSTTLGMTEASTGAACVAAFMTTGTAPGVVLEDCATVGVAVTETAALGDAVGAAGSWGTGGVTSWIDAAMNGVMTDGARSRRFALGASGVCVVGVDAAWVVPVHGIIG